MMIAVLILGLCMIMCSTLNYMTMRNLTEERRRMLHMIQANSASEFVALEKSTRPPVQLKSAAVTQPYGL